MHSLARTRMKHSVDNDETSSQWIGQPQYYTLGSRFDSARDLGRCLPPIVTYAIGRHDSRLANHLHLPSSPSVQQQGKKGCWGALSEEPDRPASEKEEQGGAQRPRPATQDRCRPPAPRRGPAASGCPGNRMAMRAAWAWDPVCAAAEPLPAADCRRHSAFAQRPSATRPSPGLRRVSRQTPA